MISLSYVALGPEERRPAEGVAEREKLEHRGEDRQKENPAAKEENQPSRRCNSWR
jgi:hypothetical protein